MEQQAQSTKARKVAARANDLVLNTYYADIFPEDTLQIEVWETPTNIPDGRITEYFSDDTEVVTVDENGLITAIGPGKASVIEIPELEVPLVQRPEQPQQTQEENNNENDNENREIVISTDENEGEYTNIPDDNVPLTNNPIIEDRQHGLCVWFYTALVLALINIGYIIITSIAKNNKEDERAKES